MFVDFIAERIIATQMDLLRLLNDGGVNGGVNGGVRSKSGGVNLEELIYDAIKNNPGANAPPTIAEIRMSLYDLFPSLILIISSHFFKCF